TIVANIFGATSMGVAATATAQVRFGNSTKCLKPWLVPDRFNGPDWAANLPFNPANDTYAPPTGPGGTGFGRADFGTTITLTAAATSRTFYRQLDLSGGGEADFLSFITGCAPLTYSLGDFVTWFPLPNPNPGFQGDQDTAITAVVSQDASAASGGGGTVVTSCAPSSCTCTTCANGLSALLSPRIVIIALVDPSALAANTNPLPIVNLMSMLLLPPDGTGNIRGVIVPTTGLDVTSEESVWFGTGGNTGNAFIAIPTLVR
ncbi:MAG TPA: hypothetical protein VNZ26_05920, partial [Vicinamibacterales bacterium]|nr:hypothetical protein [Vicinamibacterales bacterium]